MKKVKLNIHSLERAEHTRPDNVNACFKYLKSQKIKILKAFEKNFCNCLFKFF